MLEKSNRSETVQVLLRHERASKMYPWYVRFAVLANHILHDLQIYF